MDEFIRLYANKIKCIEDNLIVLLEDQENFDVNFSSFRDFLHEQKISENKYEIKSFLYLIVSFANNYHRQSNFFTKIDKILTIFKDDIQKHFTEFEIFHIFQSNKRLLLFLFQSKIAKPSENIFDILSNKKYVDKKYLEYFYPEFSAYFSENEKNAIQIQNKEIQEKKFDKFNSKRVSGENGSYVCYLIRNDLIDDFVTYMEKNNTSPSSRINPSIYETNSFLLNESHAFPSLIEYTAFCGSMQIFLYLYHKKAPLEKQIWQYAIHGKNAEIIHFLEDNNIETVQKSYQYLIIESIKCHHNDIAVYLKENFCRREKIYDNYINRKCLKYYNFSFIPDKNIITLIESCRNYKEMNTPYYLSKYDYLPIIKFLCDKCNLDVNHVYTIYTPPFRQTDIVSSIKIKNNDLYSYPEEKATSSYQKECLKTYRKYDYNVETSTILHIAVQKGNIDIIKFLISFRSIDLQITSTFMYKKPAQFFDSNEYDVITKEKSISNKAVMSGYPEIVQLLTKFGLFNFDEKVLKTKVFIDNESTARFYYKEENQKSLIQIAILEGYLGMVKLLLTKIDINIKSCSTIEKGGGCIVYDKFTRKIEKSSLYYAIKKGNIKLIQFILKNTNADINFGLTHICTDYSCEGQILDEKSPLYIVVELKNLEIARLLLDQPKINVNFISTSCKIFEDEVEQMTAKELAVLQNNMEMYQLLSEYS